MHCGKCQEEVKTSEDIITLYFSHLRPDGGSKRFEFRGHKECFAGFALRMRRALNDIHSVGV